MSGAILFEGDEVEHLDRLSDRPRRLKGSKLLWVDVDRRNDASADEVAEAFNLDEGTRNRLASSDGRAVFQDFGRYIHVTTYSPCKEPGKKRTSLSRSNASSAKTGLSLRMTSRSRCCRISPNGSPARVARGTLGGRLPSSQHCSSGFWARTRRRSSASRSAWKSSTSMPCVEEAQMRTSSNSSECGARSESYGEHSLHTGPR